jgi:hypothetical protein
LTELNRLLAELEKETVFFRKEGIVIALKWVVEHISNHIDNGLELLKIMPPSNKDFFEGYLRALTVMRDNYKDFSVEIEQSIYSKEETNAQKT